MNKVVTGSLWATSLVLAGTLAGCGSGSSGGDSTTVTVAGDVPIAYAQRANTMMLGADQRRPRARPGGDLMIREKSSASALEHNVTAQFTQGRGDVQSPDVSYDGKKIVFAMTLPGRQHVDDRHRAGLHRLLEHLGIRHDGGRPDRRHLPPPHRHRQRRRRADLPAGRTRLRLRLQPPDQVERQPGARPQLQGARRIRARGRPQPAHDGRRRRQRDSRSRSTRATTATRRCARTATSCSRAGTTSAAATTSRSSAPSPTAPTCSSSTARTAKATASCTRATWTRRASTPASSLPT